MAYAKNIRPVPRDSRPAVSTRTWVVRPSLSNRQIERKGCARKNTGTKSCILPPSSCRIIHVTGCDSGPILSKFLGGWESGGPEEELPDLDYYDRGDGEEAAAFIAETAGELSKLADRHGLPMLRHLLDMTQLEASDWLRSKRRLS